MNSLEEALAELRDVVRGHGLRWDDPVPESEVRATMRRYDAPILQEVLTWYRMCPPGAALTPRVRTRDLVSIARVHDEMRSLALSDFELPEDRSSVLDWFFLCDAESGGIAIWSPPHDPPRPLIWRTEVWDLVPESRYEQGLTALVGEWTNAWRAGRYIVGTYGQPAYADGRYLPFAMI